MGGPPVQFRLQNWEDRWWQTETCPNIKAFIRTQG
jgi:hypothetical protein